MSDRFEGAAVGGAALPGTGADLAAALARAVAGIGELDLSQASRGALVEMAIAAEKVKAWASALQATATAALVDQFETEHQTTCQRDRDAAHDQALEATSLSLSLSLALGISLRAADRRLCLARTLARHPDLSAALESGRIHELHAAAIGDATTGLATPDAARLVAAFITNPANDPGPTLVRELRGGPPIWSIPAHRLRPILTRTVAEMVPDHLHAAAETRNRDRHVAHYSSTLDRDGALVIHGPDEHLAAMYAALDVKARAARRAGAPETLDQLRFDLILGALTDSAYGLTLTYRHASRPQKRRDAKKAGTTPGQPTTGRTMRLSRPRRATTLINVTAPDTTLLGLDNKPAVLHTPTGDVPIPAQLARELAHQPNSTWRRILCDATTGTATDISTTYQPGTRIADYVAVRDGHTSRFPTSTARTLELDHIDEYDHAQPAAGGQTTAANLAATGKRDHQAKTRRLIDVTGNANSTLTYRDGTGHTYTSRPHPYLDPVSAPHETAPGQSPRHQSPPGRTTPEPGRPDASADGDPPDNGDPPY